MNYNITPCYICQKIMTYKQLRKGVYWLPDLDHVELSWVVYGGESFVHCFAHRRCWEQLREKRRELIRICCYKNEGPRSMGQQV
jgi:hypothetical protein